MKTYKNTKNLIKLAKMVNKWITDNVACANNYKYILLFIFILFCGLVYAITITEYATNPADGETTSNSSVLFQYNISAPEGLSNITWSWDNVNYTLFDDSLVLFMNFDNRSALGECTDNRTGCVRDLSKYGNNGTLVGNWLPNGTEVSENITWTPNGKYGGAFNFSGGVNYIQISNKDITNNTNDFTISFWLYLNTCSGTQRIINKGEPNAGTPLSGWEIYVDTSERIAFSINNQTGSTNKKSILFNCNENQWNFITVSVDSDSFRFYKNSEMARNTTKAFNNFIENSNLYIGRRSTSSSQFLNGSIDDVMIWNRTLSSSEISELYKSSLTEYDSQNWTFQSNQGLNLSDTNYYLCSSNSSGSENCSTQKTITKGVNTIITNFSTIIKTVPIEFYGANTGSKYLSGSGTYLDVNDDGVREVQLDDTTKQWYRNAWENSGMTYIRGDLYVYSINNETSGYNYITPATYSRSNRTVEYAREKGYKVLLTLGSPHTPTWLANTTTGWCLTNSDNRSCPPIDYDIFADVVLWAVDYATNNGTWNDTVELEVGNEMQSWLDNLTRDDPIISQEYNKLYNATYTKVHAKYPNMKIGGPSSYTNSPNIMKGFISNFSGKFDFITIHDYSMPFGYYGDKDFNNFNEHFDDILPLIDEWCVGYTCPRIIISEINIAGEFNGNNLIRGTLIKNDSNYDNEYGKDFADLWAYGLNSNRNLTIVPYQFSTEYFYNSNQPEFPQKWQMTSGELLEDELYVSYNVTKKISNLCPAGSTVYQSSSDDSTIKTVSCKSGTQYSTIIINTDTVSKNITLDGTGTSSSNKAYMMDKDTGTLYLNNLSNNLGIMDSYEIKYLVTPNFTLSEDGGFTKTAPTGEAYTSNQLSLSKSTFTSGGIDKVTYSLSSNLSIPINSTLNLSTSCPQTGDTIVYTSNSLDNSYVPTYSCSGNRLIVNINDYEPATGSNTLLITYNHLPQGAGGVGGVTNETNQTTNQTIPPIPQDLKCELGFNNKFFDYNLIPFFKIHLTTDNCNIINFLKLFFEIEREESVKNGYMTTGIRVGFLMTISILWLFVSFIRGNGLMNKLARKYL